MAKRTIPRYLGMVVVVVVVVTCALLALSELTHSYRRGFSPSSQTSSSGPGGPYPPLGKDDDDASGNADDDGGTARSMDLALDQFVTLEPGVFEARVHPVVANSTRLYFDVWLHAADEA